MSYAQERHERVLESRYLYHGHILNLRLDTIATSSGYVATREVVEHSETVAIVPLDEEGKVLLVWLPLAQALALVRRGEIEDAKSIIGLLLAAASQSS